MILFIDPCIPNPCSFGNICNTNENDGFTCTDPCDPNPCKNTGTCKKNRNGAYQCNCSFTTYYGNNCELGQLFFPIIQENYGYKVIYPFLDTFIIFILSTDPCVVNTCTNGDICVHVYANDGLVSHECEHPCKSNPCENGGKCTKDYKNQRHCDCSYTGYGGPHCNIGEYHCGWIVITWLPKRFSKYCL